MQKYNFVKDYNYADLVNIRDAAMNGFYQNCSFKNCRIKSFTLEDSVIIKCKFDQAMLEGCRFDDSSFVDCSFIDTNMYWINAFKAKFIDCVFINADFRGANMYEAKFVNCLIEKCNFGIDNIGGSGSYVDVEFIDCTGKSKLPEIENINDYAQQVAEKDAASRRPLA